MKLQFFEDFIQYDYTLKNAVLPQALVPTIDNMDASGDNFSTLSWHHRSKWLTDEQACKNQDS